MTSRSIVGRPVVKFVGRNARGALQRCLDLSFGGGVKKGRIPDEIPRNLPEQMGLDSARAGHRQVIMRDLRDEARLIDNYGPGTWVKMQSVARGCDGNVTLHWFRNLNTGQNVELKFTQRYYGHMRPSGQAKSKTGNSPP